MWRGNKRIIFQVFSIQKITDMFSSNHNLSLYTKLMTVLKVIHFSTLMSNQSSTWKTTTPVKLDV